MPNTSVTTEIHESLDIHRNFAAQIALNGELRNDVAQASDLGLSEILDLRGRLDAGRFTGHHRAIAADAEDVRQRDPNVLVGWDIDARYTCHRVVPLSALALFVPRVFANHAHHTTAAHDLALSTNLSN
jgi:hypothetical protein